MNEQDIISSVAYCGLICRLCHLSDECDGCKSKNNRCSKYLSETGCFQYNCCVEKKIQGCWECLEFPCEMDMYSDSESPKIKSLARCIKEDGIEKFASYILQVIEQGLDITKDGDLDHKTEKEVLAILRRKNRNR